MEPFRLACPHCSSKIVVRHEQLLGKTLPCPKCNEPISVPTSPPLSAGAAKPATATPSQRVAGPVVNSAALTKVGDPDWDQLLAGENFSSGFDQNEASPSRFQLPPDSGSESEPLPSPFSPLENTVSDAPIFQQGWQSQDVAKRRQWLTLATIGITSSLLAVGCFVAFMKYVGNSSKADFAAVPPKITTPPVSPPAKTTPTELNRGLPDASQPDGKQPAGSEVETIPPSIPSSDTTTSSNEVIGSTGTTPGPSSTTMDSSNQASSLNPLTPNDPSVETPAKLGEAVPSNPPTASGDEELDMGSEAEPIFFGMLEKILKSDTPLSDAGNGNIERQEDIPIESAEVSFANAFHPAPAVVPNWNDKAKLLFPSFKADDTNLLKSLDVLGRLAGVGITVDWQSCHVANIDLHEPFQIDEKAKTIEELLSKVVTSRGLEWHLDSEGMPLVSATTQSMNAKLPKNWSLADLFPEGGEKQGCERLINLWGLSDVCKYSEGQLIWDERATPIEKSNVLSSLYELARIRQLAPDHAWQRPRGATTTFFPMQWKECTKPLQNKIKLSVLVSDQRPITDLLMKAATETDLDLVIDWQKAWSHGLTPGVVSLSVLRGRTFPQVAKKYLSDYSLVLIPISERSVWMTTDEARRKMIRVVPVQLPKNLTLDDMKRLLQTLAPLGPNEQSRYRITPIPGTEDLFFARICSPNVNQLDDPDLIMGLSWPE